jgi:aromatic ring-opening dioxygenase LigB subunit
LNDDDEEEVVDRETGEKVDANETKELLNVLYGSLELEKKENRFFLSFVSVLPLVFFLSFGINGKSLRS